jgi:rfaE bifunctional protein kinase chain/domain
MIAFPRPIDKLKILVIGDVMIDHYVNGVFERISPEAPVPIVDVKSEYETLGGAGNVIENLIALGVKADLLSVVGDDAVGKDLIQLLNQHQINSNALIVESGRNTTKKSRIIASKHQLLRIDKESKHSISSSSEDLMIDFLKNHIQEYDIILVSDYGKGVLSNSFLARLFEVTRKAGKRTIVDPKGTNYEKYRGATIIKPNRKEASIATGIQIQDEQSLKDALAKLMSITHCETVIVTLSEEGMAVYDGTFNKIPTKANEVYDVTGAGDTVLACLGLTMAAGYNSLEACNLANHAAAIVVSRVGSATTNLHEIEQHMKRS